MVEGRDSGGSVKRGTMLDRHGLWLSDLSAAHEERAREHQKDNGPLRLKKSYGKMLSVRRNGIEGREQARIESEQKECVYSSISRKKKGERMLRRLS